MNAKTADRTFDMIPYNHTGEIDCDSLDFDPYEPAEKPDAMEQHIEQHEIFSLFRAYFADYGDRANVFVDFDSNICYDRTNLRRHISPDVYIAFEVNAAAIRSRRLYLPWEVGKPPDFVVEVASRSTAQEDVDRKPEIYEMIKAGEYWMFDATGGRYYGEPLRGRRLVDGKYRDIELTTEPDGVLKGYSEALGLSLAWDGGVPRLYDRASGKYIENAKEIEAARRAAETQRDALAAQLDITEAQLGTEVRARIEAEQAREAERSAAQEENRRLREIIRRLESR